MRLLWYYHEDKSVHNKIRNFRDLNFQFHFRWLSTTGIHFWEIKLFFSRYCQLQLYTLSGVMFTGGYLVIRNADSCANTMPPGGWSSQSVAEFAREITVRLWSSCHTNSSNLNVQNIDQLTQDKLQCTTLLRGFEECGYTLDRPYPAIAVAPIRLY